MKSGVIFGNRSFFADELCLDGRRRLLGVLQEAGVTPVILPEDVGAYGSVQNREQALKCAALFKEHDDLKGVIISLPNFGDEKSIVTVLREAKIDVPILVHAFNDHLDRLNYENRRDSFCGKISVCNNLRQYGFKFTLTTLHTVDPESPVFKQDLQRFLAVCRVVGTLKGARIGLVGVRPADFNTVRFSEKILEHHGISVEPIGLIDVIGKIDELGDAEAQPAVEEIKGYMSTDSVPEDALAKMAKLLVVLREWVRGNDLHAVAIQCWDSLQRYLGINSCAVMSMLSQAGVPAACESDVAGAVSMLALQAASGKPSALVDWNNNYADDPDRFVLFHCGNFAKEFYDCASCRPVIDYPPILASTLGQENTYGAIDGRMKPGKATFARITTDDLTGTIRAYCAEGQVTDDSLATFGSWGVVKVPGLQKLMRYICENGFEHHVAMSLASVADVLAEALGKYLGWDVYHHA